MILNNTKSFRIPIISIILLSLAFNFLAAPLALAVDPTPTKAPLADEKAIRSKVGGTILDAITNGGIWALNTILAGVLILVSRFTALAGLFFEETFIANINPISRFDAIKIGWTISRDIANMFFILILLVIAIATILRIQSYNAKALLPKLIFIALLINFSLTIGYVIIDASNVLSLGFYKAMTTDANGKTILISDSIMQGTAINNVLNVFSEKATSNPVGSLGNWIGIFTTLGITIGCVYTGIVPCVTGAALTAPILGSLAGLGTAIAGWFTFGSGASFADAVNYFYLIMIAIIYSLPLIFVFIFGGILLLIRIVILAFLLILAPLAFLFYILPTTEKHWNTWWEKLISHAFFLPAFMFLLYISLLITNKIALAFLASNTALGVQHPLFLINMILILIFLISSLLISRTMGIYFAGSVLNWATASRKWLTGAVGGVAARNLVAPIGARLQQAQVMGRITRASPTLGYYAREAAGWLAGRGKAPEQAENMARAALGQAESTWGSSFQKLNRAGKEAMLRNMTPEQRATFVNGLTGGQKTVAESILRSPQFSSAEQAKFNLEGFRRLPLDQQKARFATYDAQTQESILKGLNDEEKANFIGALGATNPALATSAENMLKSRLSPRDYQNFNVARILRKPEPEQRAEWLAADPTTGLPNLSADDKEALLRKKDAKGHARFIEGFVGSADKAAANDIIQNRFSAGEQRAYKEAVIENIASKSVDDLALAVAAMPPEDLKIFAKVGDDGKIASLMNTMTDRVKAKAIGNAIKELGLETKYKKYFNPVDKVEFLDQADAAAPDFIDKVKVEIQNTSPRDLSQRTQAKTIDTDNFKKAFLGGGSVTQLVSLIDNPAKVRAVKQMLTEAASGNIDRYKTDQSAVINTFETQYHNKELGQQIVEIRNRAVNAMSPVERQFIKQIFGY